MQFFRGDEWKALAQVKAHLIAKHRPRTSAGAIAFFYAVLKHVAHEGFVLVVTHGGLVSWLLGAYYSSVSAVFSTLTVSLMSAVLPSIALAEQYLSCESLTARSTACSDRFLPRMTKSN